VTASNGFWEFTAGGYGIGKNATPTGSLGDCIADTGTTLLYLPSNVVTAYYNRVASASYNSAQGGYVYSCAATLPDFSLVIGGRTFVVPGADVAYSPIGGSQCFGGIQANTGIGFNILGDIFLKSAFVVFDQSQASPRIGFANKA